MRKFRLWSLLVSGLSLLTVPAASALPFQNEFSVVENSGSFTLTNNSNNWVVFGFEIERPALASQPTTSLLGWSAYTCFAACNVNASPAFGYATDPGVNIFTAGILPHTSRTSFFFTSSAIQDGTSNTIVFSEPLEVFIFAAAKVASITDGTSNTIVFGESDPALIPVKF